MPPPAPRKCFFCGCGVALKRTPSRRLGHRYVCQEREACLFRSLRRYPLQKAPTPKKRARDTRA